MDPAVPRTDIGEKLTYGLSFFVPFTIYVFSMSSQPATWDTAELQGVQYILGIAHPTGFPMFTLLGYVWTHIVAISTPAFRANLMSGTCVAFASVLCAMTARELRISRAIALGISLWFSVGTIVWTHAIRADVHDLALLACAATAFFAIRWVQGKNERDFILLAGSWGVALSTHLIAIWLAPALLVAMILSGRIPSRRTVGAAVVTWALPMLSYGYLPLRSWYVVAHHLDEATLLPGMPRALLWNYGNPHTWPGFVAEVTGSDFRAGNTLLSALNVSDFQHVLWSWIVTLNGQFGICAVLVALLGLRRLLFDNWKACVVIVLIAFGALPFTFHYAGVEGDIERYQMLSLWCVAIFIGALSGSKQIFSLSRAFPIFVFVACSAIQTFCNNETLFAHHTDTGGRATISAATQRIPKGSLVLADWVDATALAYGAYADGTFAGRIIVPSWPLEYAGNFEAWLHIHPLYLVSMQPVVPPPRFRFTQVQSAPLIYRIDRIVQPKRKEI